MTIIWDPKDQPIYQTSDTFQQMTDKLNIGRIQLDSDLNYIDLAIGPDITSSGFTLMGLTTATKSLVDAINELDAELGDITPAAMGVTANTVSGAIFETDQKIDDAVTLLNSLIAALSARVVSVYDVNGTLLNP